VRPKFFKHVDRFRPAAEAAAVFVERVVVTARKRRAASQGL
jgi:hypothetical protein